MARFAFSVMIVASSAFAQGPSARFEVGYSEKLDAATFLNAISDEPRFNGVHVRGSDREEILDLLAGEPGKPIDLLVRRGAEDVRMQFELR